MDFYVKNPCIFFVSLNILKYIRVKRGEHARGQIRDQGDMNILAVDDEYYAIENLTDCIKEAMPEANVKGFRKFSEVMEHIKKEQVDICFLDVELRGGHTGFEIAKALKEIKPDINIIFTTAYSDYAVEAMNIHASGYILKPVTPEKVKAELDVLRFGMPEEKEKKLEVKTFGNFELFMGGVPVSFKYSKTREFFAYLVDRQGALCRNEEIAAVLWPDEDVDHTSYMKQLRSDMLSTFSEIGCSDIIERNRGMIGVLRDRIDCDYYEYLNGRSNGTGNTMYRGEYMSQYSWAEYTNGRLSMENP